MDMSVSINNLRPLLLLLIVLGTRTVCGIDKLERFELYGCTDWLPVKGVLNCEGVAGAPGETIDGLFVSESSIRWKRDGDALFPSAATDGYSVQLPPLSRGSIVRVFGGQFEVVFVSDPRELPQSSVVFRAVKHGAHDRLNHDERLEEDSYEFPLGTKFSRCGTLRGLEMVARSASFVRAEEKGANQLDLQLLSPIVEIDGRHVRTVSVQIVHVGELVKLDKQYHRLLAIVPPDDKARKHGWFELSQKCFEPTQNDPAAKSTVSVTEVKPKREAKER
jgi:hypothetical protein